MPSKYFANHFTLYHGEPVHDLLQSQHSSILIVGASHSLAFAETDCRCKIGRKWRLHDVAVGIPLGAHVYLKGGMGWNDRK